MKKWIWIVIGSVVLVAGGVTFGVVLANTKDVKATSFTMDGTWQYFEQGNPEQTRDDFFVFKDGKATNYRAGEVYRESNYTLSDANATMTYASIYFKDWNKGFVFERKAATKNIFSLYDETTSEHTFVRVKDDEYKTPTTYTVDQFQNKIFDVILHAGTAKEEKEYLQFTETQLTFVRNEKTVVPYTDFKLEDNLLSASVFKFLVVAVDENSYRLVESTKDSLTHEDAYLPWEWSLR